MKKIFILILFLICSASHAGIYTSFRSGKLYSGDGRWYKNGDSFLFRINEGTGNEENIVFSKNPLQLAHKVKYKLCFKIVTRDCHLDCKGELVKDLSTLNPWEEPETWIPSSDGSFSPSSESACK